MKAIDYFDKYQKRIFSDNKEEAVDAVQDMFAEFVEEANQLAKSRNIKKYKSFLSVLNEMNRKWNAVSTLMTKKNGYSPIKENGFINGYNTVGAVRRLSDTLSKATFELNDNVTRLRAISGNLDHFVNECISKFKSANFGVISDFQEKINFEEQRKNRYIAGLYYCEEEGMYLRIDYNPFIEKGYIMFL